MQYWKYFHNIFHFRLWTWVATALAWATCEHSWALSEQTLSKAEHASKSYFSFGRARLGSLEARLHFPPLVSRGRSYFGSDKDHLFRSVELSRVMLDWSCDRVLDKIFVHTFIPHFLRHKNLCIVPYIQADAILCYLWSCLQGRLSPIAFAVRQSLLIDY